MLFNHLFFKRLLIVGLLFFAGNLHAQDLFKGKDLSQIKVDQLSDADIVKLKTQLTGSATTIDQMEQMAINKGMSQTEFNKLRDRVNAVEKNASNSPGKLKYMQDNPKSGFREQNSSESIDSANYKAERKTMINPLIFGAELYTGVSPSFEPNLKLATPVNYVLGPDDQIQVSVYGVQQYEGELVVSPEGNVSIPNVGIVKVAGLTIEAATQRLKTVMGNSVYPYLKSGDSKLSVTLSRIRSIKVTIIGSSRPGNYTISSLATVFNALYVAGGPSAFGSFREIELIRAGQPAKKIDLYRFLLQGDQSDNVGLKDNDVIRIPAYKTRVEITGQVKRPGIFEVLPGESFANILAFASGFTDTAYRATVKIYQRNETERQVHDLRSAEYGSYQPKSGDAFVVSKILTRFENRVIITGSVFRPDTYELTPGLRVGDLIRNANGLKEDAYTGMGQVMRLQEDLTRSIVSFNIKKALAGDPIDNVLLQREDEVLITSILDLRDSFRVTIQGEIRLPGQYEYVKNLTLKDLILQAGGFTDAAYKNIEIARLIKRDSVTADDNRASSIINTEINGDLSAASNSNVPLQAFDVITVRRKAGYTLPESVLVSGQVQYAGPYVLSSRKERVSEILTRAGGATPDAYLEGAYLKRYKTEQEKIRASEVVKKLQKVTKKEVSTSGSDIKTTVTDTLGNNSIEREIKRIYDQIPLDLVKIMRNPGSVEDLVLRANDELYIPKFDGEVKISGSVLLATQVPFVQNRSMRSYLNEAGGFSGDAWRRKTYVVYANGRAATTRHFLFIKKYPKILPGSELVVPQKPERKGANTGEIIGIASAIASLAGVVIAILRL